MMKAAQSNGSTRGRGIPRTVSANASGDSLPRAFSVGRLAPSTLTGRKAA